MVLCEKCGNEVEKTGKPGRPFRKCLTCRGALAPVMQPVEQGQVVA